MITINNLIKKFNDTIALNGIDLNIEAGKIYGVIGPDGAGKTTLLRIIAGLLKPTTGNINVLGFKLPEQSEELKEQIGYMPQKFSLYTDLTVYENLKFFADIYGIEKSILEERIKPLLHMSRLSAFSSRLAGDLSGGMKQKLALTCTLIHRPKLLILDEPTTGVDPVSRRELWEILQSIVAEGVSIILTTAYMDEAEWCGDVIMLYKGKIVRKGSPDLLKQELKEKVCEAKIDDLNEEKIDILRNSAIIKIIRDRYRIIINQNFNFEQIKSKIDINFIKAEPTIEDVFINAIN
jgi:ABC-2 type transport system ATP-binding protein